MNKRTIYSIVLLSVLIIAVAIVLYRKSHTNRQADNELRIGVVLPLTGATARYGKWIKNAIELARDEHNSNPSNKHKFTYVIEDDGGETGKAVSATQKLISIDKVPVIFGTWSSSGVLAMSPIVESAKVVLMADAVSPKIRAAGDWVFRCVPDAKLSLNALEPILKSAGHKRLALTYINNDFGKDLADYMERLAGQNTTAVVFKEGYAPGTSDFRTLIEKIRASRPDSWFIAGYVEQGTLIRQAKELGFAITTYASPSFENQDILLQAGIAAERVTFPSYFDPASDLELMKEFLTKYQNTYSEPAEGFGASGYIGVKALAMAIEKCQLLDSDSIRHALNSLGTFQTIFGETYIDEVGDMRYRIFPKTVTNGKFVGRETSWRQNMPQAKAATVR